MLIKILQNNYYLTYEDIYYHFKGKSRVILKGFYFNGGSIPRIFWSICHPLFQPYVKYFLIHDFHYSNKCEYPINRKESDEFLLFQISSQNKLFGLISYILVRIFGKSHFKKDLPFNKNLLG